MKNLENKAYEYSLDFTNARAERHIRQESFLEGAKSPEAKAFHQQGMYSEEDLKNAWCKGYNKAVSSINEDRFDEDDNAPTFKEWFEKIKKK